MGLTRKELNRFPKKELLKTCKENGIECNSKSLKSELVNKIFKNKQLRGSLIAPPKRVLSEKQKKNLSQFRFKKTTSIEQDNSATISTPKVSQTLDKAQRTNNKIDPTGSNKLEPAPRSLRQDPAGTKKGKAIAAATVTRRDLPKASVAQTSGGRTAVVRFNQKGDDANKQAGKVENLQPASDKKFRDRASQQATLLKGTLYGSQFDAKRMRSVDNHTGRLLRRTTLNKKKRTIAKREFIKSVTKTTDLVDRNIKDKNAKEAERRMNKVTHKQIGAEKDNFDGELEDIGELMQSIEANPDDDQSKIKALLEIAEAESKGLITPEEAKQQKERIRLMDVRRVVGRDEALVIQQLEQQGKREQAEAIRVAENNDEKVEVLEQVDAASSNESFKNLVKKVIRQLREQKQRPGEDEEKAPEETPTDTGETEDVGLVQSVFRLKALRVKLQKAKEVAQEESTKKLLDEIIREVASEREDVKLTQSAFRSKLQRIKEKERQNQALADIVDGLVDSVISEASEEVATEQRGQQRERELDRTAEDISGGAISGASGELTEEVKGENVERLITEIERLFDKMPRAKKRRFRIAIEAVLNPGNVTRKVKVGNLFTTTLFRQLQEANPEFTSEKLQEMLSNDLDVREILTHVRLENEDFERERRTRRRGKKKR